MIDNPDDMRIWRSWLQTANQVDEFFKGLDLEERRILTDLGEILRTVDSMLRRPQDN
jgi:hypothetical protein